ncbi:MAG: sigma-70 family RNA polymerase sigma factor [Lachnospiraceae bacterium]|nr:sigma-70 family RNA polymerase sigma factor [Lachnospiraceae bacterium]
MEEREFEECIRQMQAGDKEGLKRVYQAYAGLIYSVVYDMTGQKEDAQDIASEFFIRLWERADTYRFGNKHRGWMLTIARNMAIDFLRKRKRELPVEEVEEGQPAEDVASQVIENLSFQEAMSLLKPGEQEVLDMKILGQMTFQEIADVLKKPMGTVSWLYRRGIGKLRKHHKKEQEVQG